MLMKRCILPLVTSRNSREIYFTARDIKGANILVDPNGEIKLVDFGMAKHVWIH